MAGKVNEGEVQPRPSVLGRGALLYAPAVKVGFASSHGGCLYYRAELPARTLQAHGVDAVVSGSYESRSRGDLSVDAATGRIGLPYDDDEHWGEEPDVVLLAGAYPSLLGADVILAARRHGQVIVCDLDDWPWTPPDNPTHHPEIGARKIEALRAADHVTCSTAYLSAMLDDHQIRHTLCRNTIDVDRYTDAREDTLAPHWKDAFGDELLRVGYRGLLAGFHDADVRVLRGNLPIENTRYVHVGSDPRAEHDFAELAGISPVSVDERQAVDFTAYGAQLAGVDVAVIPYADRPASQAKSNIAALEWTAAGVPWVAVDNAECHLLDPAWTVGPEWVADLVNELRDPTMREIVYERQRAELDVWVEALEMDPPWLEAVKLATSAHRT